MLPVVIMIVFFVGLVIGSAIAESLGRLPTAKELEEQDQARYERFKREM